MRRSQTVTRAWVRADGMGPGRRLEVTQVSACGVCPLRISDLNGSSFPAKQSGWSRRPLICFTGLPSANHRALRLFLWFPCNGPLLSGNRKGRGQLGTWNPETSPEPRRVRTPSSKHPLVRTPQKAYVSLSLSAETQTYR